MFAQRSEGVGDSFRPAPVAPDNISKFHQGNLIRDPSQKLGGETVSRH